MSGFTVLLLGLVVWSAAHLFKRYAPNVRASMGTAGRAVVAIAVIGGIVLMTIGYRNAEGHHLYALPQWSWHLNHALMFIAIFLTSVGNVKGVVRSQLRHPMLLGVIVWAVAHLLVNGDTASIILFLGVAVWAVTEMIVINKVEGPWQRPERGSWSKDAIVAAVSVGLYAVIVVIHNWVLGYSVLTGA